MTETQELEQNSSYPYMTAACFSMMCLNIMIYPIGYLWKKMFPEFEDLANHIRQNDVNIILRNVAAVPVLGWAIYVTIRTFMDLNWYIQNETLIASGMLVMLMIDLFDLSQRHKFEWQPFVHHFAQTIYSMYIIEWGPYFKYSFPLFGLVTFSLLCRPFLIYFPLRRVTSNTKSYAKFSCWIIIISISFGLGVMLGLIILYGEELPLSFKILHLIVFVLFQLLDAPLYLYIYRKAFKTVEETKVDRTSVLEPTPMRRFTANRASLVDDLDNIVHNTRHTILGFPYFKDGGDLQMNDFNM